MNFRPFAVLLFLAATPAAAIDVPNWSDTTSAELPEGSVRSGLSVRGAVSTLGFGGEAAYRINDRFGLRAPFGKGEFDFNVAVDGYDVDGTAKLGGFGLMADVFPFGGAFHVSGGAFHTSYGGSGLAKDVKVDGITTDVQLTISQKSSIAPVAAIGWDWRLGRLGVVSADLGAVFGKGFNVEGREMSGLAPQESVDDRLEEARDMASKLTVLPYVKIAVGFRF